MRLLYVASDGYAFLEEQECINHEKALKKLRRQEAERALEDISCRFTALFSRMNAEIDCFLKAYPEMTEKEVMEKLIPDFEFTCEENDNEAF